MCSFDNQRVDWVAWASVQIYGARDAIDDACTTSSVEEAKRVIGDGEGGSVTAPLGVRDTSCSRLDFSVISLGFPRLL